MRKIQFIMFAVLALAAASIAAAARNDNEMALELDRLEEGKGNSLFVEATVLSNLKETDELSTGANAYCETTQGLVGNKEFLITSDFKMQVPVAKTTFGRHQHETSRRIRQVGDACK
jgi:hypothetical protein